MSSYSLVVYDVPEAAAKEGQRLRARLQGIGTRINLSVWLVKTESTLVIEDWNIDPTVNLRVIAFAESETAKVLDIARESFARDITAITDGLDRIIEVTEGLLAADDLAPGQQTDLVLRRQRAVARSYGLLNRAKVALLSFQLTDKLGPVLAAAAAAIKAHEVALKGEVVGSVTVAPVARAAQIEAFSESGELL